MDETTPALSPSIAFDLITESALLAWTHHRKLGNRPKPPSDTTDKGSIWHEIFCPGGSEVEVFDYPDFRTKEARQARDDARAAGRVPIVREKWDAAKSDAAEAQKRMESMGIRLMGGLTEVKLEWTEESSLGPVLCHGIVDWMSPDHTLVRDLKTGDGSVNRLACTRKLLDGGAMQDAAYRRAVTANWPEVAGRVQVEFIFVQTKDPYDVVPAICAGSMEELGESQWRRAVELWARCLKNDHWPGVAEEQLRIEAPAWALAQLLEEEL